MSYISDNLTILAIDTSCDETSVAVTRGLAVLANAIYSQLDLHKQYGGVVPGIAKLAHEQKFDEVLHQALAEARLNLSDVDVIAVTQGPGLAIALEVGIARAKKLVEELNVPLMGINHMAGHLCSAIAGQVPDHGSSISSGIEYPVVAALVSGGHTEFILMHDLHTLEKVGQTVDDACGEAFDKFATMLGLEYPGGPIVSKLADEYRDQLEIKLERDQQTLVVRGYQGGNVKYQLPIPMANSGDLNVSFSGLKTATKQVINELSGESGKLDIKETGRRSRLSEAQIGELCVMFEEAALRTLLTKLDKAIKDFGGREVWLGGGVAANQYLQKLISSLAAEANVKFRHATDRQLLTDNAAMIGVATGIKLDQEFNGKKLGEWVRAQELGAEQRQGLLSEHIYIDPADFPSLDRLPGWSL